MLLLDGRDLLLMPESMRMLLIQILAFQIDGIFWQMLVFRIVSNSWFRIGVFVITLQNGVVPMFGKTLKFCFSQYIYNFTF
jgi:hypothetical protein